MPNVIEHSNATTIHVPISPASPPVNFDSFISCYLLFLLPFGFTHGYETG